MTPWGPRLLQALQEVITGAQGLSDQKSVGIYRSGPDLAAFFRRLNLDFRLGAKQSRCPTAYQFLASLNGAPQQLLVSVLEAAACPDDYEDPEMLGRVVEHLREPLAGEGLALRLVGTAYKLQPLAGNVPATTQLVAAAARHSLGSVEADFDRATQRAESDPEAAITAACSTLESVCKCILEEMKQPLPNKKDVKALVNEVAGHLHLSPARTDLPPEWEQDLKQILGGLATIAWGIGSLRTHAGDAHGRGRAPVKVDARIARLAIHTASTLSVFLLDTWQQRSPAAKEKSSP